MKKYGKKWRKLEAEKKIERERVQAKAGEPFSSARKKKILCLHYGGRPGGIIAGWCYSLLVPISEEECMCRTCKKRFPIGKLTQMEELVEYLSGLGCVRDEEYFKRYSELSQGLEPVYFRRLSETETEILEVVKIG